MQITGWLPDGVCDKTISQKAAEHGLRVAPISEYCTNAWLRGGLLLGYTAFNERQIKDGAKTPGDVLKSEIRN